VGTVCHLSPCLLIVYRYFKMKPATLLAAMALLLVLHQSTAQGQPRPEGAMGAMPTKYRAVLNGGNNVSWVLYSRLV
jgi:hypothetical protein